MKRRTFIVGLGGAVAARPIDGRAQQGSMPVIGYLSAQSSTAFTARLEAFRKGLRETGFNENENLAIEYRYADGRYEHLEKLARDLVDRRVNVIVSTGANASTLAAKSVTSTTPIVFTTGDDPTKLGFTSSLNNPGGNIIGVSFLSVVLGAKRLSLLLDLLPATRNIRLLANPASTETETYKRDLAAAARTLGKQLQILNASSDNEIDVAFNTLATQRNLALIVGSEGFFTSKRQQIIRLAARHSIPAIYPVLEYTMDGGLICYGADIADQYRQAGVYAGRILKGEKPATMPVALPTKFELIINMKTANTLGINVPLSLQQIADEVIE